MVLGPTLENIRRPSWVSAPESPQRSQLVVGRRWHVQTMLSLDQRETHVPSPCRCVGKAASAHEANLEQMAALRFVPSAFYKVFLTARP